MRQKHSMRRGLCGFLLACPLLYAGTLQVSPVRIELDPSHTHTLVQITNLEERPVTVQSQVLTWEFREGGYASSRSNDFLITPPIFTLNAGQTQILRLGLRRASEATTEVAYRLVLEEIPRPVASGFSGLQILLRVGIPIFFKPAAGIQPRLIWRARYRGDGGLTVFAENRGNAHVQIRQLELRTDAVQPAVLSRSMSDYVFPGQTYEWTFDSPSNVSVSHLWLTAWTDGKTLQDSVPVNVP